jgi:hypothetical protein
MKLVVIALSALGLASAFTPPASVARASVSSSANVQMFVGKSSNQPKKQGAKGVLTSKPAPLSPGSNYPTTKNIQTQGNGFGSFVQKFQTVKKSKYGVPIFLPNGNINPQYLAKEREDMRTQSKANTKAAEAKRKKLIDKKEFELADYVRKKIGDVGSGSDYYQSGR